MRSPDSPRIGRRYRPERLSGPYDALVIGSGIGGLATASLLSATGQRVAVLEQHYTAGGATHSYERKGYEWDVGVHYVGDMGARTSARRLMDFLTEGRVTWAAMEACYDRYFIGDEVFDAVAGKAEFRDALVARFPAEEAAIDQYLSLVDRVAKAMPRLAMLRGLPSWAATVAGPLIEWRMPRELGQTTWEVLSSLTSNRDLIAVLSGQWGDFGLPPRRASFAMQAMITRHYRHGGYYPVGGAWRIAQAILPRIQAAGGEVFTYARVDRIEVQGGRVAGVRMADGSLIESRCVISDAGVQNTFARLLPAEVSRQHGYDQLLSSVEPSSGHLCVYIGLKATDTELCLPRTNFWVYPSNDSDAAVARFEADPEAEFPVVYISFPSAKDPDFQRRHPGKSTIEIVAPAAYRHFERWAGTVWGHRGADYEAFKTRLGERLLEVLYARMPQLRGRIDYWEVSTPLSMQWFGAWPRGELYGLNHDPARMQARWLRPRTRVPGLWLTGQDVLTCGVTGAMMAGMSTALAVAGMRKLGPVMKQIFG